MSRWDQAFEFDVLGRALGICLAPPCALDMRDGTALGSELAAQLVCERAQDDRSFRAALAEWVLQHASVWSARDELQLVDELVRDIQAGLAWVCELAAPHVEDRPRPAQLIARAAVPKPLPPVETNEIVDDHRSLLITECPPLFDPRVQALRITYLLRDLHGYPVELRIRSIEQPEPPLHRRMLAPAETPDGANSLEWDGRCDASGELVTREAAPLRVELHYDPTYNSEATTTLPDPPELQILYAAPDMLRCDNDSAVLVPAPWTAARHPLAAVARAAVALLDGGSIHGRWLAVVGHASQTGSDRTNDTLSEQRALGVRALLERDEAAWVELARKHGSLRDVIAYLDHLSRRGWPCAFEADVAAYLATQSSEESAHTRAAVEAFQAEFNARFGAELKLDGVVGKRTLAAVFTVLDAELERWLAKLGSSFDELPLDRVVYLGYGSTLAGRTGTLVVETPAGTEDPGAADRIVDLLVVEDAPWNPDITAAELYDDSVRRRPFEIPDDDWSSGPFTIVSDLTPEEPAAPETYLLSSEDNSWAVERVLPADGEVESGELVLRFDALPTEHSYTLVTISSSGKRSLIFENVPYGELYRAAPGSS